MEFVFVFLLLFSNAIAYDSVVTYRLPTTTKPLHYSIKIHPDIEAGNFSGTVQIQVRVSALTNSITLHSSHLTINEVFLNQEKIDNFTLNQEYELMKIFREEFIAPGNHIISIKFNGTLRDKIRGLFKASFSSENVVLSTLVVTDFQPTFARTAFPCFDEPKFKAKFQLNVIVSDQNYTAISNTEFYEKIETSKGWLYRFKTTPVMSVYLLAFAITNYKGYTANATVGAKTIPIEIYSYNNTQENVDTIVSCIQKAMKLYTDYTDFEYPLTKIDFIEYDRNVSLATENWGLITMKKGLLSNYSTYSNEYSSRNIVHEIAHYWFGNLVTNEWWNDVWLQESTAEFMTKKALDLIFGNHSQFKPNVLLKDVFMHDKNNVTFPIVPFIETPNQIKKHFETTYITYRKGYVLLTMLESVVGKSNMKTIMKKYLNRFAYKTATTNDFIEIVEETCVTDRDNLRDFLETFLFQNNVPVIDVDLDEEKNVYVWRQHLYNDTYSTGTPNKNKWTIPVSYLNSESPEERNLLFIDKYAETVSFPKNNVSWIIFDNQEAAYLINYSENMWQEFHAHREEIETGLLNNLILEAGQLFLRDIIPCGIPFKFLDKVGCGYLQAYSLTLQTTYLLQHGISLDQDAFEILKKFISAHTKIEKVFSKFRPAKNLTMKGEVKQCAAWIKANLKHYISGDTSRVCETKPWNYIHNESLEKPQVESN